MEFLRGEDYKGKLEYQNGPLKVNLYSYLQKNNGDYENGIRWNKGNFFLEDNY